MEAQHALDFIGNPTDGGEQSPNGALDPTDQATNQISTPLKSLRWPAAYKAGEPCPQSGYFIMNNCTKFGESLSPRISNSDQFIMDGCADGRHETADNALYPD